MPGEEKQNEPFDPLEPARDPTAQHLRQAAEGSLESLEWIVATFSPGILATARRCHRPSLQGFGDPEDVVQDVWLRTLGRLETIEVRSERGSRDLLHYLGTCVSNHYSTVARKLLHKSLDKVREDNSSTTYASTIDIGTATGIVTNVAKGEMAQQLQAALDEMDEMDRDILVRRGLQQLPNRDVAMLVDISESSISSRYRRALARIRTRVPGSLFDLL